MSTPGLAAGSGVPIAGTEGRHYIGRLSQGGAAQPVKDFTPSVRLGLHTRCPKSKVSDHLFRGSSVTHFLF